MPPRRTAPLDGRKIRQRRESLGRSVADVARQVGCHEQSLRNVELNNKRCSIPLAHRIADALDTPLADLLSNQEDSLAGAA